MNMSRAHNKSIEHQYDVISNEFDTTRVRIWTSVQYFLIKNASLNKNGKTLLDVGVGNGKNIIFANNYNYKCIGIDISNNLLDICRKKALDVFKKDILDLNESFGTFDTIICIATIHHLEDTNVQKQAIINMLHCLKEGGNLLISVWSKEIFNNNEKSDYRNFNIGHNIVKWNSKDGHHKVDRFYYIHDYTSFEQMFKDISLIIPINYEINWEKQNWFCEITKQSL